MQSEHAVKNRLGCLWVTAVLQLVVPHECHSQLGTTETPGHPLQLRRTGSTLSACQAMKVTQEARLLRACQAVDMTQEARLLRACQASQKSASTLYVGLLGRSGACWCF